MSLKARDVMRRGDLVLVSPRTTIGELERILTERQISGVPVVNDEGQLVGVVSQRDIVELIHEELTSATESGEAFLARLRSKEVLEIMQTRLHTVTPSTDITVVAKILRKNHIHRVPVVEDQRLVGIITTLDLVRPFEDPELVAAIFHGGPWKHWTPFKHAGEERRWSKDRERT